MRNKREAEPDFFDMLVDLQTWNVYSPKPPRIQPTRCRATPKRIYTAGGATFDRATGAQIVARAHLSSSDYSRKVLVETLRKAQ